MTKYCKRKYHALRNHFISGRKRTVYRNPEKESSSQVCVVCLLVRESIALKLTCHSFLFSDKNERVLTDAATVFGPWYIQKEK